MAKVLKMNGGTFLQRSWQDDYEGDWRTVMNDNRRERRDLNTLLLQMKVDELAKSL